MTKLSGTRIIVLAAILAGLLIAWTQQISDAPIRADGIPTLVTAVNLQHHGAYSLARSGPRTPTMYREPFPVFVTAAVAGLVDATMGKAELPAYFSGERARLLKLQNLLWLTLLCGASFLVTFRFTSSFALSALMGILSHVIFFHPGMRSTGIDSLYTEIQAAALLVLASWCYALGTSRHSVRALAASGLLFGLLALTKASTLYVFAGLLLAMFAFRLLRRTSGTARSVAKEAGVLVLAFGIVVAPWMYRNWVQFGTPAISERGGLVLYFRALYNDVNAVEYRGLFYIWAPRPIRAAAGRVLGYAPEDLDRGGRLFRLNMRTDSEYAAANIAAEMTGRPQDATSLVGIARAERTKVRNRFEAAGLGQRAHIAADDLLKQRALRKMLDNPRGEFAMTLAALWRGGLLLAPIFLCAFVYAWRERRDELLAFCLPSVGLTLFYALFTVFEPRYSVPMTPVALLAAAVAVYTARLSARLLRRALTAGHGMRRWPKLTPRDRPAS